MKKCTIFIVVFIFAASFQFPINSYAQDGSLDVSFGSSGKVVTPIGSGDDEGISLAIQSDGKIVVAGNSTTGSNNNFAIARYNTNGTLDLSFGTGGKLTTDFGSNYDDCRSVAIQSDGKIVASGSSHNGTNWDIALARYNTDGTPDLSFGSGGKLTTDFAINNDYGFAMAIQGDGKIVVTGISETSTTYHDFGIARYNTNGTLDLSFDTDGKVTTPIGIDNDTPRSIAIQSDGKIVVAGYSVIGDDMYFAMVRYNSNGSLDTGFDNDGKLTTTFGNDGDYAMSVAIQSDAKIVVAGFSYILANNVTRDIALARYNSDGTLDNSFDTNGMLTTKFGIYDEEGFSVAIQSNGKILVAGYSNNGAKNNFALIRYNINGALDLSFDTDGKLTTAIGSANDEVHSVAIQSDGKIVVAGTSLNGANLDFALVRYNNTITTGIDDQSYNYLPQDDISFYPNPTSDFIILSSCNESIQAYSVYDISGRLMIDNKITLNINEPQLINVSSLSKSIYFLKIITKHNQVTKKIIIN